MKTRLSVVTAIVAVLPNLQRAVSKFGITYPATLDNDIGIWKALHNKCWAAHYFIYARNKVSYEHFDEGERDHNGD